ncbi:ABC transporter ATP-binding protein [Candidatus Sumerlaeota bacterium]|nr:ABC transporter ATP-binding protein [Candidatus Sumerlaeota bacterium]
MIRADRLSKNFGKTEAIRDVSFCVEKGEILGFLGPNGSGKTTTMRILSCHTPPTKGTARIAGYDVTRQSREVRRKIGYMPETFGLYDDMTVRSYLDFIGELKGLKHTLRRERVNLVMEQTGLKPVSERLIRNLSKGYRQRAGLAQSLVGDPEILILDEPTVGLDPAQIKEIRTLILSMKGVKTIVLSTHILQEVAAICTRIAIVSLGRIAAIGAPEELAKKLAPEERLAVLAGGNQDAITRILKDISGVLSVKTQQTDSPHQMYHVHVKKGCDIRKDISASLIKAGCDLYEMYPLGMSLEEVYMNVVMGGE